MNTNSSPENTLETNLQPDLITPEKLASLSDPDVYYQSLLKTCKEETLSNYLYQNREDEKKMFYFFESHDWESFSIVLSDADRALFTSFQHFRELCQKIEELKKNGPEKAGSEDVEIEKEETKITSDDYYEKVSKIRGGSSEKRVSLAIQNILFIIGFFVLVWIDMTQKTDTTIMVLLYLGLAFYFGISLLITFWSGIGGAPYSKSQKKSMEQWVNLQNRQKEQALTDAKNEFNRNLRNLEKQRWDTYAKMQEAEQAFLNGSRAKATSVRSSVSASVSLSGKTCSNCGGNMSFDPRRKLLICPFCGNTRSLSDTTDAYTLQDLDDAIAHGQYNKASAIVVDLKKKHPDDLDLLTRSLCCSLRAPSVFEALSSRRKLPGELQRVLDWDGWEKFDEASSTKAHAFSNQCRDFCERAMLLLGVKPKTKDSENKHSGYVADTEPTWLFALKVGAVALAFLGVTAFLLYFTVTDQFGLYKIVCCLAVLAGIAVYIGIPLKNKYDDLNTFSERPKNISGLSGNEAWEEKKRKQTKQEIKKEENALDDLLARIKDMEKNLAD